MRMVTKSQDLESLSKLVAERRIKTFITKFYPLNKAREAWDEVMSGHTKGKLILYP